MANTPVQCNHDNIVQRRNYKIKNNLREYEIEVGFCKGCVTLVGRPAGERLWRILLIEKPQPPVDAPESEKKAHVKKVEKMGEAANDGTPVKTTTRVANQNTEA